MVRVIVEREFEEPVGFEEVERREAEAAWCLEVRSVRFVRSFFSSDRRRMLCEYEAPDAESVRAAQLQAGLPFTRVWSSTIVGPSQ